MEIPDRFRPGRGYRISSDGIHPVALVLRFLLGLVVCVIAPGAFAAGEVIPNGSVGVSNVPHGIIVEDGNGGLTFIGRNFSSAGTSNAVTVAEDYSGVVGGNQLALRATRVATAGEVSLAAAGVVAAGLLGLEIGSPIAKMLGQTDVSIGNTRCTATASGWQCDPGEPATPTAVQTWDYSCYAGMSCQAASPTGAVALYQQGWKANALSHGYQTATATAPGCQVTYPQTGGPQSYCTWSETLCFNGQCSTTNKNGSPWYLGTKMVDKCHASIDALNPMWDVLEGASPNADGLCPTGRYSGQPPEYVGQRMFAWGDMSQSVDVAADILRAGGEIPVAADRTMSGPAQATGATQTTTTHNPDGSTTTTTTTPTTNYQYNGSTITWTPGQTVTVTSCDSAGACQTSTSTTTTTGTGQTAGQQEQQTDCDKYPDIIGCSKYGDIATDKPESTTKDIQFTPEALPFTAACPADRVLSWKGWSLPLRYQPACDVAPTIAAGLRAMVALSCLIWIISALRQ